MARRGTLTGGTGDVKPQVLTAQTGFQSVPNAYVFSRIPLPVPRFGTQKGKATIFEFLKVSYYFGQLNLADAFVMEWAFITPAVERAQGELSDFPTWIQDVANPKVLALATLGGSGGTRALRLPITIDLTDNAGNGVLVATDSVSLVFGGSSQTAVGSVVMKLLYRQVNVGVQEYVGIVQSQL